MYRNPALERRPNPLEVDPSNDTVFGKERGLLPRIRWILAGTILSGGSSSGLFNPQPLVRVFNFFNQLPRQLLFTHGQVSSGRLIIGSFGRSVSVP